MKHRPVALLDACVLVPMPRADTLLRLAEPPAVFEARWPEDILGEMSRTLVRRFGKTPVPRGGNAQILSECACGWLPAPHQSNGESSERPPCSGRSTRMQGRLFGRIQSPRLPRGGWRFHNGWKLDRSAIESRLREQAVAIGFGVEELLDRLAPSVPAFVELLRSRD
jgi:hypothetical protein